MDIKELEHNIADAIDLLKVLSHKGRLQVMCALQKGEKNVGELETITGLSQSALSQHLAILRKKGVVETRRSAQTIYYSSNHEGAKMVLKCLSDVCCGP